ncbi:MAG: hypothetical protein RLZZ344_768 [Pseudomonadota bacterium]|jgi:Na+-transporting methylmalonyl-CoA/oxaloacetate decarboxylase gamma subunit
MNSILLFSILAMLAVIMLLMILIVDQVRGVHRAIVPEIEEEPEEPEPAKPDDKVDAAKALADEDGTDGAPIPLTAEEQPDASFGNLVGKRLWDAMTGKPLPDVDEAKVGELKPRYHVILTKHIEELFAEGLEDGRQGKAKMASNKRKVTGLRGTVISWIPQQHADTIYRAGFDSATATDAAPREAIQGNLSETIEALCARTDLRLSEPLPAKLVPISIGDPGEPLQLEMAAQPQGSQPAAGAKAKAAEPAEAVA